ncbi:Peptidase family C25, partial [Thermoplasmatales archaeon SCGC AB-539-N05]
YLIIAILFGAVVFPSIVALNKKSVNEKITLEHSFQKPLIKNIGTLKEPVYKIEMPGLPNTNQYNEPRLPVKPLKILLPQGKDLEKIEVIPSGKTRLASTFNVELGSKVVPLTPNHQVIQKQKLIKSTKEETHNLFSEVVYSNVGIHIFRGYPILHVNLFPVQYDQVSGKLYYYKHIELVIKTKDSSSYGAFRGLLQDRIIVTDLVDNPSYVSTYNHNNAQKETSSTNYDYIIITNDAFKNAAGEYTFQNLIDSKLNKGLTAGIFTVEEIVSNQDYWVDGKWGDNNPNNPFYRNETIDNSQLFNDKPAKIRNFIRHAYMDWNTSYVLLGGDADEIVPKNDIIPLRGLFADEEGLPLSGSLDYESDDIPSDVYYACLDGCFNYDNDFHFGECAEFNNDAEVDEADLYAEVWVGRCCADSAEEVSNFVMKTLWYAETADPYLSEIMFVGEDLGPAFYFQYGGDYKDMMEYLVPSTYNVHKLYDGYDFTWYPEDFINELYTVEPQIINHDGHGYTNYMLKMGSYNFYEFENEKPFFIYSHSCLTGSFDNYVPGGQYREEDCIAEIITCEIPYGAYACILNARYGLGSEDSMESPSGAYDESFYKALFMENIRELGRANHYSKEDNIWRIDENGMRWCYYQTNLFGDPELKIQDPVVKPDKPSKPSGPNSGKINTKQTYSTSTIDPQGDQVYYWFEWGGDANSGWIGPFNSGETCEANHTWTEKGVYQIKVKAKDIEGHESDWSESLIISMPKNKNYMIDSISKSSITEKVNNIKNTAESDMSGVNLLNGIWLVRGIFKYLDDDEDYIYLKAITARLFGIGNGAAWYRLFSCPVKFSKPFYGVFTNDFSVVAIGICNYWEYL